MDRTERREELYAYLKDHPHTKFRCVTLAVDLGIQINVLYRDLSIVRHWAQNEKAQITNCYRDPDDIRLSVFQYLPPKQEQMQSVRPLRTQSRRARTVVRNLGKQAEYTAKNAERKEDRAYARIQVRIADFVTGVGQDVDDLERQITRRFQKEMSQVEMPQVASANGR